MTSSHPEVIAGESDAGIADWLHARLSNALIKDGEVAITVPGGSTPFPIFAELAKTSLAWSRLSIWPGDDRIVPEDAGLTRHPTEALRGGDAAYNAAALRRLLQGEEGAYRDAVLLNAAAALIVAGEARDWQDGVEEACEVLDNGLANALLDCWIRL